MPEYQLRRLAARWIGWTPVRIWGMVPVERLRRSLARAGVWDSGPWTGQAPVEPGAVLLLLGDHVYDDGLVDALAHTPDTALVRGDGRTVAVNVSRSRADEIAQAMVAGEEPPADLPRRKGSELVQGWVLKQRKRAVPLVMPVSAELRTAVEDRLFVAAIPGITDVITKYLWPLPAQWVTRACVSLGLSANAVTLVTLLLTVVVAALFHGGWLWAGLVVAWAMALLDTVDGALARVTLSTSQLGGALDHAIDFVHPPLWWWAWWVGCGDGNSGALVVMVLGWVFLRTEEMLFHWRFQIELHLWRRFDSLFRLVTARRNVVLAVLTVGLGFGHPLAGFQVAAGWMLICLTVHAIRILQAARQVQRGEVPESWLED
ncbi:MAG: CDP-alcohol phosphatidyltransferase family protein [Rhodospirillaceae bacterium]|nr:CDP-alcohol phosphatidyltransferase family protein [Rhodospirillales bacterium]